MIIDLLKTVCTELEQKDIEYMLSGSLAMNVYTVPRMTRDIDIVINIKVSDIEKFKEGFYIYEEGPVPEGMSAMEAAKSEAFINRHEVLKEKVSTKAAEFLKTKNYTPPYWELVRMAEETTGCK
jgi:pyridoxine/pyridoxamine 5'-phosphate oxidase